MFTITSFTGIQPDGLLGQNISEKSRGSWSMQTSAMENIDLLYVMLYMLYIHNFICVKYASNGVIIFLHWLCFVTIKLNCLILRCMALLSADFRQAEIPYPPTLT